MRISPIRMNTSFSGRVIMNKRDVVEQLADCPKETRESLIGNINTLKRRIEAHTPDYKTFTLEFEHDMSYDGPYCPIGHYGIVHVKDEAGRDFANTFDIACTGGKRLNDKDYFADGETVWQKGFKRLTEEILNSPHPITKPSSNTNLSGPVQKIYDRIKDRDPRIIFDKEDLAKEIFKATNALPEDVQTALVDNINTLTGRMETKTSPMKRYKIFPKSEYFAGNSYFTLEVRAIDKNCESSRESIALVRRTEDGRKETATGQDIWDKMFKRLTEKVLWDGYHHLPYSDGYESDFLKTEIFNKLS